MEDIDDLIVAILISKDPNVFKYYFKEFGSQPDQETRENAEKMYDEVARAVYNGPECSATTFDTFVKKYRERCQRQRISRQSVRDQSSSGSSSSNGSSNTVLSTFTEGNEEEQSRICNKWNLIRPKVSVVPPVSKKKRNDEEFNVVEFLLKKKKNEDYFSLTFQSDEDVQEDLTILNSPEKNKLNSIADEILKKMAHYLEILNKESCYQILYVQHEKFR